MMSIKTQKLLVDTYHILLENNVLRGTLHWGQFESIKRRKADNVNTMSYIIFGNYNVVTCSSRSDLEYYIYILFPSSY